jgi:hypothetical protein
VVNPITLTLNGTTATFTSTPAFPTITAPDYAVIVVEPDTVHEEIIQVTAFTAAATTATVVRNFEATNGGANAAPAHTSSIWVHGATSGDFGLAGLAIFGDGSDGTVTFDGSTTLLGMAPSSSVYTLTRDIFLAAGTINSSVTINTAQFRVFCQGLLTNNGTISSNGGSGSNSGVPGAGGSVNTFPGRGQSGGSGATGAGGAGASATNTFPCVGGAGGGGGAGAGGGGGSAGALGTAAATQGSLHSLPGALTGSIGILGAYTGAAQNALGGGGSGGAGGGDGTHFGGGGGGGGGCVGVYAKTMSGTGAIRARGGDGGGGYSLSTLGAGGGGGGGGGWVVVISSSVASGAVPGQTIDANGGSGGAKVGTTGANGSNGSNGSVILIPN